MVSLCSISVGFLYLNRERGQPPSAGREDGVECGCLFFFACESPVSPQADRASQDTAEISAQGGH